MIDLTIETMLPNGDCAVLLRLSDTSDRLSGIHALAADLISQPVSINNNTLINLVPAVDSLVLVFGHPISLSAQIATQLGDDIKRRIKRLKVEENSSTSHEIAVCYDPEVAPDIESVCQALEIGIDELIQLHTKTVYRVDMLGFLPGFAYLSVNHKALNLPRKDTPSLQVPAGSVAIAGHQTGLYALPSPGGWHVIGRTAVQLIDWSIDQQSGDQQMGDQQPMLLNPLDQVTFKAIDLAQFKAKGADRGK